MSRPRNLPTRDNRTFEELETSAKAPPMLRTNLRLMGIPVDQFAVLCCVNKDFVSHVVRRFNDRGIRDCRGVQVRARCQDQGGAEW
ncbi:MAG: hypothetical protein ACP5U1_07980 [Desulfomonilaceae bacterium]